MAPRDQGGRCESALGRGIVHGPCRLGLSICNLVVLDSVTTV